MKLHRSRGSNGPKAKARIPRAERYRLRLFVTGQTERSLRAVSNLRRLCEEHLKGQFDLEVVDISQQPVLAVESQVIAAPTLIKSMPLPLRRLVGDFSDQERVIVGLDLRTAIG